VTTTTAPSTPTRDDAPARPNTGRAGIVAVLIASLVLAGLTSNWARRLRTSEADIAAGTATVSSLANMNSFSLALLLGGLRGPLVMFLWTNSENLKNEKNLEDFDTYVEWIRLLQPEFDTVHIFQVWNKAYNISVQMAAVQNKYTTILDALDYAHKVEQQRPNNVSMLYQIGSIYFDKLGGAQEKAFYRDRVRAESKPHLSRQKLSKNDPGWRRLELDPILDANGMILPELLTPRYPKPTTFPAETNGQWVNGAEMQFLEPYQPFPYGVSTLALGFNYARKAALLQAIGGQIHANLSPTVLDSRPALSLKGWSEDEWERARRQEMKALNVADVPTERRDWELPTASIKPDAPISQTARPEIDEAIYSYNLGARLAQDALADYQRHLRTYSLNWGTYQSHMDELTARAPLLSADRDYLKAMVTPAGPERQKLLDAAAAEYKEAVRLNLNVIFRYYTSDEIGRAVLPAGVDRQKAAESVPLGDLVVAYLRGMNLLARQQFDPDAEDRSDFQRYVDRSMLRLRALNVEVIPAGASTQPTTLPATTTAPATAAAAAR
jgi:hypothetical protein